MPGGVARRSSAAGSGVAAAAGDAAAGGAPAAAAAAPGPGAAVARASGAVDFHANVRGLSLVRAEFGVVQFSHGVRHVLLAHKLDHAGAVPEDVGVAHVSRLAHVVLQVLPAAALG